MTDEQVEFLVRTGLTFDKNKIDDDKLDWHYPKGAAFAEEKSSEIDVETEVVVSEITEETGTTFEGGSVKFTGTSKSPVVVSGDSDITVTATDDASFKNVVVSGEKGESNGKINFTSPSVSVKNVSVPADSAVYNVFEGCQDRNEDHLVKNFEADKVTVDGEHLKHNVFNIYQPADNAKIVVKNSTFSLDVDKTNVMRLSNYANKDNVTVEFNNVNWKYFGLAADDSNAATEYAGLVLYQPANSDVAANGADTSHMETWTFKFKDCYYDGTLITNLNANLASQLIYTYKAGDLKPKVVETTADSVTIKFAIANE